MFFYLSKLFWILATPLNFIWLLVLAGFGIRLWKRALGNRILTLAAALFLIFGFLPVGYNMMVFLERQYERPDPMPARVDGIIVLGGAFNSALAEKTGMITTNSNIGRVIDFIDLAQKYPKAKLVFSGGSGHIVQPTRKEVDDAKIFLTMAGMKTNKIIFERDSRNSYENIRNSKKLAKPKAGEKWVVITSASHMPRVMGVAKQQEWQLIPYPSSPKTDGEYRLLPQKFSVSGSFGLLDTALKEFIGIAAYYFSGKSAFLFPRSSLESEESKQ